MTRRGIIYNLYDSHYNVSDEGYIFFFSSLLHLKKYNRLKEKYKKDINLSLSKRFGCGIRLNLIGAIKAYTESETRGFLIYDYINGVYIECLKHITLSGALKMQKNFQEKLEPSTQNEQSL